MLDNAESVEPTAEATPTPAQSPSAPADPLAAIEGLDGMDKIGALMQLNEQDVDPSPTESVDPSEPEDEPEVDDDIEEQSEEADTEDQSEEDGAEDEDPESTKYSSEAEFLEGGFHKWLQENPDALVEVPHKDDEGRTVKLPAKKVLSYLGKGAVIDQDKQAFEEEKSEWREEYQAGEQQRLQHLDNLGLAVEFQLAPQVQQAAGYLKQGKQAEATILQRISGLPEGDAGRIELEANLTAVRETNNQNIEYIRTNRPVVDQFAKFKQKQVEDTLAVVHKEYKDAKLRNTAHREKLVGDVSSILGDSNKITPIPGVTAMDLLQTNEQIMLLLRDGLAFRAAGPATPVGQSTAKKSKPVSDSKGSIETAVEAATKIKDPQVRIATLMELQQKSKNR